MYSKITVIGHLGRDPEMKYTPAGKTITSFSIASSRNRKDVDGNKISETIWFKVSTFDKLAENCNAFLKKGSLCQVEGKLSADFKTGGPRIFTRKDGSSGASFEIMASEVTFLTSKKDIEPGENTNSKSDSDDEFAGFPD